MLVVDSCFYSLVNIGDGGVGAHLSGERVIVMWSVWDCSNWISSLKDWVPQLKCLPTVSIYIHIGPSMENGDLSK